MFKHRFSFWQIGAALMAMMPTQARSNNSTYEALRRELLGATKRAKSKRQGPFSVRVLQSLGERNIRQMNRRGRVFTPQLESAFVHPRHLRR